MSPDTKTLIQRLTASLGENAVLSALEDMSPYLLDERRLYQGRAACVVLPSSTEQVVAVVNTCRELGYAIVPQGGNTGYCGGASPGGERQVLLSLSRMNRVLEIDTAGSTATVEAGVILTELHQAAESQELFFPLSMGSEDSCQIGGMLSTNAGGLAVLQYGTAGELALGLEVALPSGQVLDLLSGLRKDNTGYHLSSLFCGAEGTLGIITRAALKLYPRPTDHATALLAVPDPERVIRLLSLARRMSGDRVTSFEYISGLSLALALSHLPQLKAPLETTHAHLVLLELSGPLPAGSLSENLEILFESATREGLVIDGVVAESESRRRSLWQIREGIPEAEKLAGRSIKHDVSIPIGQIPRYLELATPLLDTLGEHRSSIYGHIGDGNLHYNILAPADSDPAHFRADRGDAFSDALHGLAVEMRGSFSAEHGIGKLKAADLVRYKDPVTLATMRELKQALDPDNIMNPGKLFPLEKEA